MKYLEELNQEQKVATLYNEGNMSILAGAGSGKTKTLIAKITHLIEKENYNPASILAITFTNKAAGEMKKRMEKYLGDRAKYVQAGTFHAMCARFLRPYATAVGLKSSFTIYDTSESYSLIKKILNQYEIPPEKIHPGTLSDFIDKVKNKGMRREDPLLKADEKYFYYLEYEKALKENNAVDFNSLITKMGELLRDNPEVRKIFNDRFKYIFVDEFQDTNTTQIDLILLLKGENSKICVVYDDWQQIYGWRFASIKNVMDFEKLFNAKEFKLERNYRSTKNIVEASNFLIKNNVYRKDKTMYTTKESGEKIKILTVEDNRDEALLVAERVKDLLNYENPEEIAVFYRNNAQSRNIEEYLRNYKIPYELIGGQKFYERKEIKDVISYMRLIVNPDDILSFERIFNTPARGIGKKSQEMILSHQKSSGKNIIDYLVDKDFIKLSKKVMKGLNDLSKLFEEALSFNLKDILDIYEHFFIKSGYKAYLEASEKIEDKARLENLLELKSSIKNFRGDLKEFLESITLDQSEENQDKTKMIKLMTLHGSKGLEFNHVFIIACEENIIPSIPSVLADDIEEERRLFYVGMTRAKEALTLLNARSRMLFGKMQYNYPSRFLGEIPKEFIEEE